MPWTVSGSRGLPVTKVTGVVIAKIVADHGDGLRGGGGIRGVGPQKPGVGSHDSQQHYGQEMTGAGGFDRVHGAASG